MYRNSKNFRGVFRRLMACCLFPGIALSPALFSQEEGRSSSSVQQIESNTLLEVLRELYRPDDLSADLEDGRFSWRGNSFDIGNFRAVRARFNRFLNSPLEARAQEEYAAIIDSILSQLSTANQQERSAEQPWRHVIDAWELLFEAASHPMDAGASEVIANTVYNYWRNRSEFDSIQFWNAVNRAEQRRTENRAIRLAHHERLARRDEQSTSRLTSPQTQEPEIDLGLSAITPSAQEARDSLELRAIVEADDLASATIGLQSQLHMQSAMVSFLAERRFQHALIMAQFYRHLFRGSAQELTVGRDTLARLLPDANFVPTVDILESVARQAREEVRRGVESILQALEENQAVSALERMMETFLLGEHSPEVLGFPLDRRRQMRTLEQKLREIERLAELRDFEAALEVASEVAREAHDFPLSEIQAAARAVMSASNLALFAARSALIERDRATARQEMALATELWPLNPAITDMMETVSSRSDAAIQGALLFDDALTRSEFRRIFDRRGELMVALIEDEERLRKLQSIIEDIARIDMLIAQAEELVNQANPHAAWELLLQAGPAGEDDPVLNRAKTRLAPAVARFIGFLENARRAEERGEPSVALMFYLKARELYPASREVRLGLERAGNHALQSLQVRN